MFSNTQIVNKGWTGKCLGASRTLKLEHMLI